MLSTATKESAKITKEFAKNDLQNAAYNAEGVVNETVDNLSEYANRAGRTVRHYIDNASDEISHASEKLSTEIRTNPIRSSLIALAAGFVIGSLIRR